MTPPWRLRTPLIALALCAALTGPSVAPRVHAAQGTYIVQANDTLSAIAARFGISVAALVSFNSLVDANHIVVGQVLALDANDASAATATTTAAAVSSSTYAVQPGDTLSSIALRYGVSLQALANVNGLSDPSRIFVGQQLTIPADGGGSAAGTSQFAPATQLTSSSQPSSSTTGTYVVQAGDTLSGISQQFGVTLDSLITANSLSIQSVLTVGQQLTIPATNNINLTNSNSLVAEGTIGDILTSQAIAAGVDPSLVKAVAWQESGWQMVTASDGGMGVMQLMPDAVSWVSTSLLGYQVNPYDPTDNIRAGVAMLRYFLLQYGDVTQALAAYHQGMGSLELNGILPETQSYIDNILALQQRFAS